MDIRLAPMFIGTSTFSAGWLARMCNGLLPPDVTSGEANGGFPHPSGRPSRRTSGLVTLRGERTGYGVGGDEEAVGAVDVTVGADAAEDELAAFVTAF